MAVTLNASTSSGFIQTADTSGELNIQSNGTTKLSVFSTGVSGTLINATAVSASGTSIDFTSIPSWAKKVSLIFNGVGTDGTSAYLIQIGSGSVTTSGYSSGGNRAGSASPVNATSTAGFIINSGVSGGGKNGIFTINLMNSSFGYVFNGTGYSPSETNQFVSAGNITLSGVLDRVRFTTVNGTDSYNAGTINIQYEG
jgi:hypothetical protein